MNTQIEHLENHTARLTVQVEQERIEKAMRDAAKKIAREVTIPGFRKGKAPYNIVLQRFGAKAVLNEAIEMLGNDIYREALTESKIEPYAPGSLENIETEPAIKLTFVVPKQPEVDLSGYRDLRLPFAVEDVEDDAVTKAMKGLQDRQAVVETASRPAQFGDQIKMKLAETVTHPASEEHEHEGAAEPHTDSIDENEAEILLAENPDEDEVMPGFSANLIGMNAGEDKEFTLSFPADHAEKGLAGHTFTFKVHLDEVKSRTVPTQNDDFAKQITDGKIDNLLALRVDVRKQLQDAATRDAENKFADEVLEKVVEQSAIKYPEEMVDEYIDDILESLDRNLKERGLSLADYKKVEKKSDTELRQEYHDTAVKRLQRALALGEIVNLEQLDVSDDDVDQQIDRMSAQFGEQAAVFRQMLMKDDTRRNIAMDLITNRALQRLVAIARGENPAIGPEPVAVTEAAEATEAAAEAPVEQAAEPSDEPSSDLSGLTFADSNLIQVNASAEPATQLADKPAETVDSSPAAPAADQPGDAQS